MNRLRDWCSDMWWALKTPHDEWTMKARRDSRRQTRELRESIKRDLKDF